MSHSNPMHHPMPLAQKIFSTNPRINAIVRRLLSQEHENIVDLFDTLIKDGYTSDELKEATSIYMRH
jgi:hypothetical protein